jgi:hypothetical protein
MAQFLSSTFRITDSMSINHIGLDTDDSSIGIYLTQSAETIDGDRIYINHDIKMPLELIQKIADLLPLLIDRANSETDKEDWETYHLYSPKELERADLF